MWKRGQCLGSRACQELRQVSSELHLSVLLANHRFSWLMFWTETLLPVKIYSFSLLHLSVNLLTYPNYKILNPSVSFQNLYTKFRPTSTIISLYIASTRSLHIPQTTCCAAASTSKPSQSPWAILFRLAPPSRNHHNPHPYPDRAFTVSGKLSIAWGEGGLMSPTETQFRNCWNPNIWYNNFNNNF